jgi:hypothetical protein
MEGYVCEYTGKAVHDRTINIPGLHWIEGTCTSLPKPEGFLKENVTFDEFKNMQADYKIRYGLFGSGWEAKTTWNNERSGGGFGLEYIDRGFNS